MKMKLYAQLLTCQELHDVFSEKFAQILKTIKVNKLYLMVRECKCA